MMRKIQKSFKVLFLISTAAASLVLAVLPVTVHAAPGDIVTVAGGYIGDGGPATQAILNNPSDVAVDSSGNVYIVDTYNQRIRKVTPAGNISTIAGNGNSAFAGDGGPATAASINEANGITIDAVGDIYIADSFNQRIRKVTATNGIISTITGTGSLGVGSHNGFNTEAVNATLYYPMGIAATSASGTTLLYIADANNNRVRYVSFGSNYDVAGTSEPGFNGDGTSIFDGTTQFNYPSDVAVDAAGNIYIADTNNNRIRKIDKTTNIITTVAGNGTAGFNPAHDGGLATAASLNRPYSVVTDTAGNIYIADTDNFRIRKVNALGVISTFAGNGTYGYSGDGGPATSASLSNPMGIALDSAGNLYIADESNNCVRKVSGGNISTFAGSPSNMFYGDNGSGILASLNYAHGVGADSSGNVYIADTKNNRIRKVAAATGSITVIAGNGAEGSSPNGVLATTANISNPYGVTADAAGIVYFADTYNHFIRKVEGGLLYIVAGTGTPVYDGEGAATAKSLNFPRSVATDTRGNLYIADTDNHRVRKVTYPAGTISTIAGSGARTYDGEGTATAKSLDTPTGVAVDIAGNVYIADSGHNRIRMVTPGGIISTVAGNGTSGFAGDGGLAASAQLATPYGIAVDPAGNLYIADFYNSKIRKVDTSGTISTFVGNGIQNNNPWPVLTDIFLGFAGDNGPAAPAGFSILYNPYSVAADPAGNVYIADVNNLRIRKVLDATPPTLPSVRIVSSNTNTTWAKPGDTVTINITASEPLATPTVIIAGMPATVSGSSTNWTASRLMTSSDSNGSVTLSINYVDLAGNAGTTIYNTTDSSSVTFDKTLPTLSINAPSLSAVRSGATVTYTVTYTGANSVTLSPGNITLNATSTATGSVAVSGTGTASRLVTISSITGNGTLGISIAAGTASDLAGNTAAAAGPSATFTVDNLAPTATIGAPSASIVRSGTTVTYTVAYSGADSVTLSPGNITLNTTSTATGSIAVSGTGTASRLVTISSITGNGTLGISIAAGTASDLAGNTAAAAGPSATFSVDNTLPSLPYAHIASNNAGNPTLARNGDTVTVTLTASEPLASASVTIAGVAAVMTGSGSSWSASHVMTGADAEGPVTLSISFSDLAGNAGTPVAATTDGSAVTYDLTSPSLSVVHIASNNAKNTALAKVGDTVLVTITASEAISAPTVTISGHAATISGSGSSWSASAVMTGSDAEGIVLFSIIFSDPAGNVGTPVALTSDGSSVTFDRTAPTLSVSPPSLTTARGSSTVSYTVTYNGADIVSLATGSVSLITTGDANGVVAVSGTGNTNRTITITGITGNGTLGISIPAGTASDAAGNPAPGGTGASFTVDTTLPTVSITSSAPSPTTNTSPIPVSVQFSEPVFGFDSTGISVSNGAPGPVSGSGTNYTFSVTPSNNLVTITVSVNASAAQDAAGNGNTASNQLSRVFDSVQPVPTISSTAPSSTNASPISVNVRFSKAVTGFTSGDVSISNGNINVASFSGSGQDYSFTVSPVSNGTVTVGIAAGVADDGVGNLNLAAVPLTRNYDTIRPTTVISSATTPTTNAFPIPFTVTFSEAVTGFTSGDVSVGNGTLSNFSGSGTTYTFDVNPSGDLTVTVNIAGSVAQDPAGNDNFPAAQFARAYDSTQPTVTISSAAPNPTNAAIPVTVTFSEPVVGFTVSDVVVSNGSKGSFVGNGSTYTFNLTPTTDGAVTVNIAAGVAVDLAGNPNSAAVQFSRIYDATAPSVAISPPSLTVADHGLSVSYTITYTGADAISLATGNITLNRTAGANGSVSVSGSGNTTSRTVTISNITGLEGGTLGISITAGTASDLAGNLAIGAGPSATFAIDNASGDFDRNGVDIADALKALRITAGLDTPTASDLAHGDVAPLVNGARQPDGKINSADVVAILRKAAGLPSW